MDGKPFKAPVKPSNPEAAACAQQGDKIRQMKAAKASKEEIMKAVDELKKLKAKHLEVHGTEFAPTGKVEGSRKDKKKAAPEKPAPKAPKAPKARKAPKAPKAPKAAKPPPAPSAGALA